MIHTESKEYQTKAFIYTNTNPNPKLQVSSSSSSSFIMHSVDPYKVNQPIGYRVCPNVSVI